MDTYGFKFELKTKNPDVNAVGFGVTAEIRRNGSTSRERERSNLCENERANVIFSWVFLRRRNLENGFRLDRVGFSSAAA